MNARVSFCQTKLEQEDCETLVADVVEKLNGVTLREFGRSRNVSLGKVRNIDVYVGFGESENNYPKPIQAELGEQLRASVDCQVLVVKSDLFHD